MIGHKGMFSVEIESGYRKGQRLFENAEISYAEMAGWNLENIIFKNCKFSFCTFRYAHLKNVKFVNCELFFIGFIGADLTNAIFENTKIEFAEFENARFDNLIFKGCDISYTIMIAVDTNAADFKNCTKFKVFERAEDITEDDVKGALGILAPSLENLELKIKNRIKSIIANVSQRHDLNVNPSSIESTEPYSKGSEHYGSKQSAYGTASSKYAALSKVLDEIISTYAEKQGDKKQPYDKKGKY